MIPNRKTCPRCKWNLLKRRDSLNAVSRRDNKTNICAECGIKEALEDYRLIPHWLDEPTNRPYWDTNSPVWLVQCEKLHDVEQGLDVLKAKGEAL